MMLSNDVMYWKSNVKCKWCHIVTTGVVSLLKLIINSQSSHADKCPEVCVVSFTHLLQFLYPWVEFLHNLHLFTWCKLQCVNFMFQSFISKVIHQGATCDNWIFHVTVLHNSILLFLPFSYYSVNCAKNTASKWQNILSCCVKLFISMQVKLMPVVSWFLNSQKMSCTSIKPSKLYGQLCWRRLSTSFVLVGSVAKLYFMRWFYTMKKSLVESVPIKFIY